MQQSDAPDAPGGRTGPGTPDPAPRLDLSATAAEDPERSVGEERDAVGDQPDEGPLVTPDDAQ